MQRIYAFLSRVGADFFFILLLSLICLVFCGGTFICCRTKENFIRVLIIVMDPVMDILRNMELQGMLRFISCSMYFFKALCDIRPLRGYMILCFSRFFLKGCIRSSGSEDGY